MAIRSARNVSAAGHPFGPLIRSPSTSTLAQPTRMPVISLSGPRASTTLPFRTPTATRKPTMPPAIITTRTAKAISPHRLTVPAAIALTSVHERSSCVTQGAGGAAAALEVVGSIGTRGLDLDRSHELSL